MIVFTYIGIITTGIFIWKRRGLMFDRDLFFDQVRSLRSFDTRFDFHRGLDCLVENVTGFVKGEEMNTKENLENDVANIIRRLEAMKKEEKTKKKAQELIQTIKDSLD